MKDDQILKAFNEALNDVDDAFIEEAEPGQAKHRRRIWPRAVAVAAVLAVLLTMTAPVFGAEYLHTVFGSWTKELFSFDTGSEDYAIPAGDASPEDYSDPGLAQFAAALQDAGITANVVPKWIPEGYTFDGIESSIDEDYAYVLVGFVNEEKENLVLKVKSPATFSNYEKDDHTVLAYEKNNVVHYILRNLGNLTVVWSDSIVECSIGGAVSIEEVKTMIDSIYSGGHE